LDLLVKLYKNFPKELLLKSGVFFITRILGGILAFIFAWWVSQIGGAELWGKFSLYFTLLNIFLIICILGLDTIIVKYIAEYNNNGKSSIDQSNYYWTSFLLAMTTSLSVCALLYLAKESGILPLKSFGLDEAYFELSVWTIPGIVLLGLNRSVYRGLKNMAIFGVLKNLIIFGGLFVVSILASNYFNTDINIRFLLIINLIITYTFAIITSIELLISKKILIESIVLVDIKSLLKESLPLFLFASMTLVVNYVDLFMISYFKTPDEVGIYDIAIKFSSNMSIFLLAIHAYIMPRFAEVYGTNNNELLQVTLLQSSKLIFWTSLPIFIFGLFFSYSLMSIYGDEFTKGTFTLQLLIIGQIIGAMCGAVAVFLQMTNNQKIFRNIFLTATIINLVLNYILIPIYGIEGAAIASLACTAFWNLSSVYFIKKKFDMSSVYLPFYS